MRKKKKKVTNQIRLENALVETLFIFHLHAAQEVLPLQSCTKSRRISAQLGGMDYVNVNHSLDGEHLLTLPGSCESHMIASH